MFGVIFYNVVPTTDKYMSYSLVVHTEGASGCEVEDDDEDDEGEDEGVGPWMEDDETHAFTPSAFSSQQRFREQAVRGVLSQLNKSSRASKRRDVYDSVVNFGLSDTANIEYCLLILSVTKKLALTRTKQAAQLLVDSGLSLLCYRYGEIHFNRTRVLLLVLETMQAVVSCCLRGLGAAKARLEFESYGLLVFLNKVDDAYDDYETKLSATAKVLRQYMTPSKSWHWTRIKSHKASTSSHSPHSPRQRLLPSVSSVSVPSMKGLVSSSSSSSSCFPF